MDEGILHIASYIEIVRYDATVRYRIEMSKNTNRSLNSVRRVLRDIKSIKNKNKNKNKKKNHLFILVSKLH